MSDPLFDQLKEAAQSAMQSNNIEDGMKHLANAFSLFSQETNKLKQAYFRLQNRFKDVNIDLEKANVELISKLTEIKTVSSYLDSILKNISQGILFIDKEGVITTCNDAAADLLKIDIKKILFGNFWSFFQDDFFGFSIREALNFHLSKKTNYLTLTIDGGENRELEISTTFVSNSPKAYQGLIIMLRDITRLQRLQMIASRNDRMKDLGEMAAGVAHEIRNPLGGIRGYAALLYRDLQGSPHLQDMANNIIEGTKTLERLVSNVLHFARPIEIQPQPHDLSSIIREVHKFIKVDPACPENIKIELHLPEEKLEAPIDKQLIRSALLNLISNAFQAIDDDNNGLIIISLMKHMDTYIITVSDNGKGINGNDLEKIFSPFFTTKDRGNGLGLSETYKIIQAHFGNIEVRSQPKIGTTFTITLPLKK